MKPAGYRFALSDSPGFVYEHDERRLKGIFGIARVSEQTPAHAPHHPLMAPYEKLKGGLIVLRYEALQQLAVRHPAGARGTGEPAEMSQYDLKLSARCHDRTLLRRSPFTNRDGRRRSAFAF